MIEAGVEVLVEKGVELQVSSVSYAKVFEHLERTKGIRVTYGSVHERIWDSLQDFQLSVIERAGVWESNALDDATHARLQAVVSLTAPTDAAEARAALAAIWRDVGARYMEVSEESKTWASWLQTIVALSSGDDDSPITEAARSGARETYEGQLDTFRAIGGRAFDALGIEANDRVPDDVDLTELLVEISNAVADGIELHAHVTDSPYPKVALRTGPNGELEEWDLYSLCMSIITDWLTRHTSER